MEEVRVMASRQHSLDRLKPVFLLVSAIYVSLAMQEAAMQMPKYRKDSAYHQKDFSLHSFC